MSDYWTNELMDALKERGVSLKRPNMTAEDAANEYAMWHYGARLASEMLSVFNAAEKALKELADLAEADAQTEKE